MNACQGVRNNDFSGNLVNVLNERFLAPLCGYPHVLVIIRCSNFWMNGCEIQPNGSLEMVLLIED